MSDKPEYIYIMYPIPIEDAKRLSPTLPLPPFTAPDDDSFMPLWFGNARFPEDDVED